MTSGTSGRIAVDPASLDRLASRVSQVRSELMDSRSEFDDSYGGLQSNVVEHALHEFNGAWSQRRGHLTELLLKAETILRTSASEFRDADSSLAGAFAGSSASAAGAGATTATTNA